MKKGRKKANIQKKEKSRQFEYNLRVEKENKKNTQQLARKRIIYLTLLDYLFCIHSPIVYLYLRLQNMYMFSYDAI